MKPLAPNGRRLVASLKFEQASTVADFKRLNGKTQGPEHKVTLPKDGVYLVKGDEGLRLSHNPNESSQFITGDALDSVKLVKAEIKETVHGNRTGRDPALAGQPGSRELREGVDNYQGAWRSQITQPYTQHFLGEKSDGGELSLKQVADGLATEQGIDPETTLFGVYSGSSPTLLVYV